MPSTLLHAGKQCSPFFSGSSVYASSLASTAICVALPITWGTLFPSPLRATRYRTGLFQLPREHVRTELETGTSESWIASSTGSQCRSRHAQHSLNLATVSDRLKGHSVLLKAQITVSSPSCQSTTSCFAHSAELQCPAMTWTAISEPPTRVSESRLGNSFAKHSQMFLQRNSRLTCSHYLTALHLLLSWCRLDVVSTVQRVRPFAPSTNVRFDITVSKCTDIIPSQPRFRRTHATYKAGSRDVLSRARDTGS
jgi:hypothetical protein